MSLRAKIKRYYLIVEKLKPNQYTSFKDLKFFLENQGFEEDDRTIQRDVEELRNEFGIAIEYSRGRGGYYIDENKSINLESCIRFLEIINTAELLSESIKESQEALNYISFDSQGQFKGTELLKPLLFAIRNNRIITFTHENYATGLKKPVQLKPYLLKEYQHRWYVVGIRGKMDHSLTYGVDRLENLKVLDDTFEKDKNKDPSAVFDSIIGLVYSHNEPQEIVLSFTAHQAKYIESLKWHHTQEIVSRNDDEVVIKYWLIPNFELTQKIMMLGDQVKVKQPVWLAEEIAERLKKAFERYK